MTVMLYKRKRSLTKMNKKKRFVAYDGTAKPSVTALDSFQDYLVPYKRHIYYNQMPALRWLYMGWRHACFIFHFVCATCDHNTNDLDWCLTSTCICFGLPEKQVANASCVLLWTPLVGKEEMFKAYG